MCLDETRRSPIAPDRTVKYLRTKLNIVWAANKVHEYFGHSLFCLYETAAAIVVVIAIRRAAGNTGRNVGSVVVNGYAYASVTGWWWRWWLWWWWWLRCEENACCGGVTCAFSSRAPGIVSSTIRPQLVDRPFWEFLVGEKKGKIVSLSIFFYWPFCLCISVILILLPIAVVVN